MPSYRIGVGSDFVLKNHNIGIGSDNPRTGLDVVGTTKSKYLDVSGVSTLTSYSGFHSLEQGGDTTLSADHTAMGDIVVGVGETFIVSSGSTVSVRTFGTISIGTHFSPPVGDINDRPEVPVEGTVRYNRDLNTLEFYNGIDWRQFTVSGASGRCLIMGGTGGNAKHLQTIDYVSIPTTGNAISFGDLLEPVDGMGACSSSIRATTFGGTQNPGSANTTVNTIQYVTIASSGDAINFGDLVGTHRYTNAATNGTRAIVFGGSGSPGYDEDLEIFNISTLGNAIDSGGHAKPISNGESVYSPTRAIFASGYFPSSPNIQKHTHYINITSTGDTIDFGSGIYLRSGTGFSNLTRGVIGGGRNPTTGMKDMYYITIASLGNYQQFGELSVGGTGSGNGNSANQTRGFFSGGVDVSSGRINTMDYVTFSSLGNAVHFGDLTSKDLDGNSAAYSSTASDSHGGLGGY